MSTSHQKTAQISTPWEVFKPYLAYLIMFLGMGLISGSIVHVAQEEGRMYAVVLMGVGAFLFALGSIMNEVLFKTGLLGDTPVRYVVLALLLAIGIGMVSGSTQHFFDTPIYASYLAPLGIFLSSLAFAIRQGYILHKKNWMVMIVGGVAFALVFHLVLNAYAKTLPITQGHHGSSQTVQHMDGDGGHHADVDGAAASAKLNVLPAPLVVPPVAEKMHADGHTDADHKKH